jgi:hypothetical protein
MGDACFGSNAAHHSTRQNLCATVAIGIAAGCFLLLYAVTVAKRGPDLLNRPL